MQKDHQDDRFGKLPDHILLKILDQCDFRDAVRTTILSRRWRQLPTMLSRLVIDVNHFLPKSVFHPSVEEIICTNAAVVEATKNILSRRNSNGYSIDLLHMTFFLRDDDSISIGRTVGDIMKNQKVETTEFIILTQKQDIKCTMDDLVDYGRQFMSLFNACSNAFGGLTRLHLENLTFGEMDVANVLSTCRLLRHLRLYNCDSGVWTMLQVVHSHLNELCILSCGFEKVELKWLPKLTKLTFEGWISFQEPLSFGSIPMLKAVSLSNTCLSWHKMVALRKFLASICVQDLTLDFQSEKIWVQPEGPKGLVSVFHKLCSVSLIDLPEGCDLTWTMFILEAAS